MSSGAEFAICVHVLADLEERLSCQNAPHMHSTVPGTAQAPSGRALH